MAVKDFETEATRIGVRSVTGSPFESSPYPAAKTVSAPCVTTADRPGTPVVSTRSVR